MAHNPPHTVVRGRTFYYNRRVPRDVAEAFGSSVVRISLGQDRDRAACLAEGLTARLDALWSASMVVPVDVTSLLKSLEPSTLDLLSCMELYLSGKDIAEKPTRLAVNTLVSVAGNSDVTTYTRSDARQVVDALTAKGNKTATVRRRLGSLHAIIEFGYHEQNVDRRNPFARLTIPGEGRDSLKRGVFTEDQLASLYAEALASGRDTRLVLPVLGETGARLAEVVGLRWADVCLTEEVIRITPHAHRRLKTRGSEREVPVVGYALEALRRLHRGSEGPFVFPRWVRQETIVATHASNTLNKHIRSKVAGLSCHCFRHTMRDRLRNAGIGAELIDQLGGWTSSALGVGASYGHGYALIRKREALQKVCLEPS